MWWEPSIFLCFYNLWISKNYTITKQVIKSWVPSLEFWSLLYPLSLRLYPRIKCLWKQSKVDKRLIHTCDNVTYSCFEEEFCVLETHISLTASATKIGPPQLVFEHMAKTHFNFLSFVAFIKYFKNILLFWNSETKKVEGS